MAVIEHKDERTLWSCMACGAIGDHQSCRRCGNEAMPGAWVPADAYRGAVEAALREVVTEAGREFTDDDVLLSRIGRCVLDRLDRAQP
jgi:hypothetical protein